MPMEGRAHPCLHSVQGRRAKQGRDRWQRSALEGLEAPDACSHQVCLAFSFACPALDSLSSSRSKLQYFRCVCLFMLCHFTHLTYSDMLLLRFLCQACLSALVARDDDLGTIRNLHAFSSISAGHKYMASPPSTQAPAALQPGLQSSSSDISMSIPTDPLTGCDSLLLPLRVIHSGRS